MAAGSRARRDPGTPPVRREDRGPAPSSAELYDRCGKTLERLAAQIPDTATGREILLFPGAFGLGHWELPRRRKARMWRSETVEILGRRYKVRHPEAELDLVHLRWREGRKQHTITWYLIHPDWNAALQEEELYQHLREGGLTRNVAGVGAVHGTGVPAHALDVYITLIQDGLHPGEAAGIATALAEEGK